MLTLVTMPIGNGADLSPRARAALLAADVIAAEDTRKAKDVLARADVHPQAQWITHHDHNQTHSATGVLRLLQQGKNVAYISDAGMPGIADPGEALVRAAVAVGHSVDLIPGPCAALQALVLSGLPTGRFSFIGFLPRRDNELETLLQSLSARPETLIFYESPRRVVDTVQCMARLWGPRPAALARELTKTYQEILRQDLVSLAATLAVRPEILGEITLVVSGQLEPAETLMGEALTAKVRALLAQGLSAKEVKAALKGLPGVDDSEVYALAVQLLQNKTP